MKRLTSLFSRLSALAVGAVLFAGSPLLAQNAAGSTGQPAPAWKLVDLDGHQVSSDQFKGKVVVVDFWATWCGPCVSEIPGYIALQKKYGAQGLVIVGVSMDSKGPQHVKKFAEAHAMNYTILMGDDAITEAFGGFSAIPTTFLIGRDGRILHQKTGSAEAEEYEKLVKQALE
jgi:peroxiredoxin